jgi:hypothetical protein
MSDDFGFEFVDEETEESAAEARPRLSRVFGDGGSHGAGDGGRPAAVTRRRRWAIGAVVAVVVLIVVVVLATGGSGGSAGAFKSYFRRLTPIATSSQNVGALLNRLLGQVRHAQVTDPASKFKPLVTQAQAQLAAAQSLRPPAALRAANNQAVSALVFRLAGLTGLQAAFGNRTRGKKAAALIAALNSQIDRLVTSDVVWHDLFLQPAATALRQQHLAVSLAPRSIFVANTNLSSPQSIAALAQPQAPATAPVLQLGSTGPTVTAWQKQLNRWLKRKHLTVVTADGSFGPGTQAATESLQRAASLTPDGVVGQATRSALATALASSG